MTAKSVVTPDARDLGPTGPAAMRRPATMETIEGKARGSVATDRIEVKRHTDAHLFDRLHNAGQIWDRLWEAAHKVLEMWGESGLEPKQSGSYAPRGWNHGHDDESDDYDTAMEQFRRLLGGCSVAHANILHAACLGEHPGIRRLATLQAALGDLADLWGIR